MEGIVAPQEGVVKARVLENLTALVEALWAGDPEDEYAAERAVWGVLLEIGRLLLTALLARRCWRLAVAELERQGLAPNEVRFRLDRDYWAVINTTLGRIKVPWFAFRRQVGGLWSTHTPSRTVLPLHPHCHSSTMLLRWETMLGAQTVFRNAERLMNVLTHGAVRIHDTTIASHCRVVASVIDRSWLYKRPEEIRDILRTRAVRDEQTDKPLLFFSCDAHAERVYDGQLWSTVYKMFNGIRVWCMDRATQRMIALGGEFMTGDCHAVSEAFSDLIERRILPADGDFGAGVVAKLVFVADGMPWFDDHILPHFPGVTPVLDAYHVLEKLADALASIYGAGSTMAKRTYNRLCRLVTGRAPRAKSPKARAGTPKRTSRVAPYDKPRRYPCYDPSELASAGLPEHSGGALIAALKALNIGTKPGAQAVLDQLIKYLEARRERIAYDDFWYRGFLISSAAMESFNRVAQQRLKLPGTTWTPEMSQAILDLRMMSAIGNDGRFWEDEAMRARIAHAFNPGEAP